MPPVPSNSPTATRARRSVASSRCSSVLPLDAYDELAAFFGQFPLDRDQKIRAGVHRKPLMGAALRPHAPERRMEWT